MEIPSEIPSRRYVSELVRAVAAVAVLSVGVAFGFGSLLFHSTLGMFNSQQRVASNNDRISSALVLLSGVPRAHADVASCSCSGAGGDPTSCNGCNCFDGGDSGGCSDGGGCSGGGDG